MAEQNTSRVLFPKGFQKRIIEQALQKQGISLQKLADKLGVSRRTLYDWKREKFLISLDAVNILSKLSGDNPFSKNIQTLDQYWYVHKGARKGGINSYKKQGVIGGDPGRRKMLWKKWWNMKGRFEDRKIFSRKSITQPKRSSDLAEFVGIMMGDGGISPRQTTITLHHVDDKEYAFFVVSLIKKLFQVDPKVYHDIKNSVNNIVVSRTSLVEFCVHHLGLPIGNKIKQGIDIPKWILKNKEFKRACIRGLIDTDGSVFIHKYKSKSKWYSYKKLHFTSLSPSLARSVFNILKEFGFNPRLSQNKDVCLDSIKDVSHYFKFIKSHNPKHLRRYKE